MTRELDAKIAELRGWRLTTSGFSWMDKDGDYMYAVEDDHDGTEGWHPSIDIRCAMELWEEMWDSGDFEWMSLTRSKIGFPFYMYWQPSELGTDEEISDHSENPCEPIYNAYIPWKEGQ